MRRQPFFEFVIFKNFSKMDNLNMFADVALASIEQTKNIKPAHMQAVGQFFRHGFTSIDMINAGYPQSMINTMILIEKREKIHTKAQYNLVNYNQLEWYTSTSPHVICPKCKGSFTLTSKNKIRTHACDYYQINGPPSISKKKKIVIAKPIVIAQRSLI